ncbi:hypothetical protein GN956_G16608 [Arapaima gigas]
MCRLRAHQSEPPWKRRCCEISSTFSLEMFAKATKNFIREIDPDGCLIPVCRPNNSVKLDMLSLIIKRKPLWFWQQPKYLPSGLTLNDVLVGEPLCPDVAQSDFLKYEGTFRGTLSGKIDAGLVQVNLTLEGKGISKLQSSFGHLMKEEVDIQKLLLASRHRFVNLDHCLVRQTRRKRNDVFGVLKERIFTTQPCSITEHVVGQGSCGAMLSFLEPKAVQVSVKKNGTMEKDTNISVEIPPHTVIAYSIIELDIKRNGEYELCLQPDTMGGFEADSMETLPLQAPTSDMLAVDGPVAVSLKDTLTVPGSSPLSILDKHLQMLKAHLQQLAELPVSTRTDLLLVLADRAALSTLETVLDELCQGGTPDLAHLEEPPSLKRVVGGLLQLKGEDPVQASKYHSSPLVAAYLLISAMDEMTDTGLAQLKWFYSTPSLKALDSLVSNLLKGRECTDQDLPLSCLASEEVFQRTKQLFLSSNINLQRDKGCLLAETSPDPGLLPLLMCVSILGLASLVTGQ